MEDNFLLQLIDEPNRYNNILDLVFSNHIEYVHSTMVLITELSDHDFVNYVHLHPELLPPSLTPERPVFTPSCLLDNINFNSTDWESINSELKG